MTPAQVWGLTGGWLERPTTRRGRPLPRTDSPLEDLKALAAMPHGGG